MNRAAFSRFRIGLAAFTLVELLVVIVIIAVLAGLLMPVMSGIRARGDSIQCVSNLHQIGIAIGAYVADNDGALPGPVDQGQLPTYTSDKATSLALILAKYLSLPVAPTGSQKAPVFICPAYAKLNPAMDKAVYYVADITNAVRSPTDPLPVSPFGVSGDPPMKLSAITGLVDKNTGNPVSLAATIALRDFVAASGTLATTWVTWDSTKPVHGDHCNTLFYDWHVGSVDPNTLQPK